MRCFGKFLKFAILGVVIALGLSLVVMLLWNALMPQLFALHAISFWQALGILVLSKILLGGFRGWGGALMRRRHFLMEHWGTMTPDEKERFRKGLQTCCPLGDSGLPEDKPEEKK